METSMNKAIKSFITKVMAFALALVMMFALTSEARATATSDSLITMRVVLSHDFVQFPAYDVENVRLGLYHHGRQVYLDRFGGPVVDLNDHDYDFRRSDIPNLEVRIVNGAGLTSLRGDVLPVSEFVDPGTGILRFEWHLVPISSLAATPTPAPTPLPTPVSTPTPPPTETPTGDTVLRFAIGVTTFTNNGVSSQLEAAPFIQNDRTMVPLRVIVEALGATNLNFQNQVVTFNLDGVSFNLTIGQPLPGGMGTPVIVADRTFVPLAFIIESIGGNARWDNAARAAYIYL